MGKSYLKVKGLGCFSNAEPHFVQAGWDNLLLRLDEQHGPELCQARQHLGCAVAIVNPNLTEISLDRFAELVQKCG